jgi:hypothetical protein
MTLLDVANKLAAKQIGAFDRSGWLMPGSAEQLHGTDSPVFRSSKLPNRPSFGFCVIVPSEDIAKPIEDKRLR